MRSSRTKVRGGGTLPDLPAQIWDHCPGATPVPKDGPKSGFSTPRGLILFSWNPRRCCKTLPLFLFFSTSFSGLPPKSLKEHGRVENVVKEGKGGDREEVRHWGPTPKHKTCLSGYSSGSPGPSLSPGRDLSRLLQYPFSVHQGEEEDGPSLTAVCSQASCPPKFPEEVWSSWSYFHTSNCQMRIPSLHSHPGSHRNYLGTEEKRL